MKTLSLRFVKEHKPSYNVTVGAHYAAECPFCGKKNLVWTSEMNRRAVPHTTNNVCEHVDGILLNGKLAIRAKMSVVAHGTTMKVNGIAVPYTMIELFNRMVDMNEEVESEDWMRYPDWCPKRRFHAIYSETMRVYEAHPAKWKKQQAARTEELERRELARLKAKYES
jgi:hypothetical protein